MRSPSPLTGMDAVIQQREMEGEEGASILPLGQYGDGRADRGGQMRKCRLLLCVKSRDHGKMSSSHSQEWTVK